MKSALAALAAVVPVCGAQVVEDAVPMLAREGVTVQMMAGSAPVGPADFIGQTMIQPAVVDMTNLEDSALTQPFGQFEGTEDFYPSNLNPGYNGGDTRYVDQPFDCNDGFYSNNNSTTNPYLTFDDFVADGTPLRNVRFYGGNTGDMFANVNYIGIEIWTIQPGGACGWTFEDQVAFQTFTLAELSPSYVCDVVGLYPGYEMTAEFSSAIPLNAGQNYLITIWANLANGGSDGNNFFWMQSSVSNYNDSESWDRNTGDYVRCGPDTAFTTNVQVDCFENDCGTTCYFSNFVSNANPFISLDDFTATTTGDLRQLQFSGGGYDVGTFSPSDLGNFAGFYIELYRSIPDDSFLCDNWQDLFYGAFQVSMADANPKFQCVDVNGITTYQFTVQLPAGTYSLVEGEQYLLGVYGIPLNPDDTRLFCWGGTDTIYGFNSWSFNLDTTTQEICHDVDQAFCVNGARPCLGDFDGNGELNTIDVLRFLNAWAASDLAADCNGDGAINTQDVLCFLNRWAAGC